LRYKNYKMFRALLTLVALVVAGCVTAPPVQEMSDARQAIMAAEQANAERVAAATLADARRFLAEAEQQIQQEAYGPARLNAVRAKNRAVLALRSTRSREAAPSE
jgi:starvation-inducible outer membrane lipoprotein